MVGRERVAVGVVHFGPVREPVAIGVGLVGIRAEHIFFAIAQAIVVAVAVRVGLCGRPRVGRRRARVGLCDWLIVLRVVRIALAFVDAPVRVGVFACTAHAVDRELAVAHSI